MAVMQLPGWLSGLVVAPGAVERNVAFQQQRGLMTESGPVAAALPGDRTAFGQAVRLWALPGPGATLRGLAAQLQNVLLDRVAGWAHVADEELPRLGAALFRVARRIETGTAEPL